MNKSVQILLLIALFPMIGSAREETLEERKQRIVRKYLRENATVTQSDMIVPSELDEDERITDSEKFAEASVSLERQEVGAKPMVVPPPAPRPVPRADANWLLQAADETAELDMFGNPVDSSADSWSSWRSTEAERTEDGISQRRTESYRREDQNSFGMRGQQSTTRDTRYGTTPSTIRPRERDVFGRTATPQSESTPSSGYGLDRTPRTFGSSPDQGLLNNPFGQVRSPGEEDSLRSGTPRSGTYQPYVSPYQKEREKRSQPTWSTQRSATEQNQRKDSYQKWKSRQNEFDPTADDAYINDMLKKNRR